MTNTQDNELIRAHLHDGQGSVSVRFEGERVYITGSETDTDRSRDFERFAGHVADLERLAREDICEAVEHYLERSGATSAEALEHVLLGDDLEGLLTCGAESATAEEYLRPTITAVALSPDFEGSVRATIYADGADLCEVTLMPNEDGRLESWGSPENWCSDPPAGLSHYDAIIEAVERLRVAS